MLSRLTHSPPEAAYRALPLIRLMVGSIFFLEGLQKFMYPALRGAGRFEKIGFPGPEFLGYFVGSFEVACGLLILLGLFTRFAAVPTFVIMTVAIITTKLPVWLGHGFGPFGVRNAPFYGFLSMAHEIRTDWAMWLGSLFLIVAGSGPWSIDVARHTSTAPPSDSEE